MAATAKNNMYSTYTLKPNQIITNVSTEMVYSYLTFFNIFPLGGYTYTAIVSADVYEFSDNGEYNVSEAPQIKSEEKSPTETTENKVENTTQNQNKKKPGYYYNGIKCLALEKTSDTEVRIKYSTETGRGFYKKIVKMNELERIE